MRARTRVRVQVCENVTGRLWLDGWLAGPAGGTYSSSRYGSMEAEKSTGQGMRGGQGIKSRLARALSWGGKEKLPRYIPKAGR